MLWSTKRLFWEHMKSAKLLFLISKIHVVLTLHLLTYSVSFGNDLAAVKQETRRTERQTSIMLHSLPHRVYTCHWKGSLFAWVCVPCPLVQSVSVTQGSLLRSALSFYEA